jgi:UDP-glucose:glycoprotein glucosyltransferase
VFDSDHVYPGGENRSQIGILYAELGTPAFVEYHNLLKEYSQEGKIAYVLRHRVQNKLDKKVRLSGYGVELQMKSTEYKAQDDSIVQENKTEDTSIDDDITEIEGFNFKTLESLYPDKKSELNKFRQYLISSSDELKPLKVWQFQELSLQAAEKIMSEPVEKALATMIHIAQNFPMQTRSLVDVRVTQERKNEIKRNRDQILMMLNLPPSDTALFLNGMFFDMDVVDVFTILETVRQEVRVMEGLYKIGLGDRKIVSSILSLDLSNSDNEGYAIDFRDSAVQWINDIETDHRYRRWSSSLMDLLKPTFPGMLRSIKRNLYNLVIVCDPAHRDSWPLLKLAESFIIHNAPVRVGLIFATPPMPISGLESASVALLNAFNYVAEEKDRNAGLAFITEVYATIKTDRDVEVEDIKKRLQTLSYGADVLDILDTQSDYNTGRQLAADFIARSGLRTLPQALVNGVPLSEKSLNKDDFEEAMLTEIMSQTPVFQKAVYRGELSDSDDVIDFIMNRPNVMPRFVFFSFFFFFFSLASIAR